MPSPTESRRRGDSRRHPAPGADPPTAAEQARRVLEREIRNGVHPAGARLPGERTLATRLSVSRETLRQALKQLAADGTLRAAPQRGWFVDPQVISDPPNVLRSFTDMARERGLRAGAVLLAHENRPASLEEARRLALAPTTPVLALRRLRTLDGLPVSVDDTVVALPRTPGFEQVPLTDASLYGSLAATCGITLARSDYTVRAAAADPAEARHLDVPAGSPVLLGLETAYDAADQPILISRLCYRADAYEFQATLYAVPS